MRMRILALIVATGAVFVAGSVTTANGLTPCPTGKYCVWADANKSGPGLILGIHQHRVSNAIGNQLNDAVSSAENRTAFTVRFYENRNGKGTILCIGPGDSYNDFSVFSFNDKTSSSKVIRSTICV